MWFPVLGSFVSQSFPDVSMTQFKNILTIKFNFKMSNCREIFPINDESDKVGAKQSKFKFS